MPKVLTETPEDKETGVGVLAAVCAAWSEGQPDTAAALLRSKYPFSPSCNAGRRYSERQCMKVFLRDGFIDRYSGEKLVFPGTLRLLSKLFPVEFPFNTNWKMDACHIAFWELFPTIDHVVPVARDGPDTETNLVSTSMLRNSAKANFTLAELGWHLLPPGSPLAWDGLTGWFLRQAEQDQSILADAYLRRWHAAAQVAISK